MSDPRWIPYSYALLRVVPHVHLGTFANVGVVLHARTAEFLGIRILTDPEELRRRGPDVDVDLFVRYARACEAIGAGDPAAGPVALLPTSERFHWLCAPRSDVLQSSPIHDGVTLDPASELDVLYRSYVVEDSARPGATGEA